MQELWSGASYEPRLLSLPFALAPTAMVSVIAYTAVMRGAPVLRGWLLAHMLALLPYATVVMLAPSINSAAVAEELFRAAASLIPLAAAGGTGFQLALVRPSRRYRNLAWFLVANAAVWVFVGNTGHLLVGSVAWLGSFWFPVAGPLAWVGLVHTMVIAGIGFAALGHTALTSRPSMERRQLRAALLASLVTYAGLLDVALSYGIGAFPIGWLLSGAGCLLVVRALVVEDLLRVRAVDTTAPRLVVHFAAAALLAWLALTELGPRAPAWSVAVGIGLAFAGVRAAIAMFDLVTRGGRGGEGPLDRLLAQLVTRARALTQPPEIATLASDIVHLGIGATPTVLLAAEADWGWTDAAGARLADEAAPDPLFTGWLAEHGAPVFDDDLGPVPPDLREHAAKIFERHAARTIFPVQSADELLALILLPAQARRVRGRGLAFVGRAADRLAEALLHARLARRAAERASLAREVELAATVQAELLPGRGPHVHGDVTVVGSWLPATRCAGDLWSVYPLPGGRVLVAIGDVTGHGVASAMVTAAALGACDVYVRRSGSRLDLAELMAALDLAVRRASGGELAMTCFAALIDPGAKDLAYVSCGHTAPYLCRAASSARAGARPRAGSSAGASAEALPASAGDSASLPAAGASGSLPAAEASGSLPAAGASGSLPAAGDPGRARTTGSYRSARSTGIFENVMLSGVELHALVGRGNPLGAGVPSVPRVHHRSLEPGDLVVWYTDGVIEAKDPAGRPYGDRRLQHLLKRLAPERLVPAGVHELVLGDVSAHRAGTPLADDETVVVAQVAPAPAPAATAAEAPAP
ncbi:MAG TPA: PP2C family protein-serine/threonine phosphatase [Kofleriaceae bacterium]|nr:PP2C family protein-serine/threonine phosphatase [Kofleriaceae bacterium]